jgi:hypothetical protein
VAAFDGVRDRWERMAPRERLLASALGVTFVVCVIGWVGLRVSTGLDAIEKRNERARSALEALERYAETKGTGPRAEAPVTIPDQPLVLSSYVEDIVREVKAQSPAYPAPKPVVRGKYVESQMRLTFKDLSIYQAKDLLEKLETASKLVVVRELKIKRAFRDNKKVDLDLLIGTFHEPKTAAAGGAAAAGAAPATPAEPTGGP